MMSGKEERESGKSPGQKLLKKVSHVREGLRDKFVRRSPSYSHSPIALNKSPETKIKKAKQKSVKRGKSFNEGVNNRITRKQQQNDVDKLHRESKKVFQALEYTQDVVDKNILQMLPGTATVVLECIMEVVQLLSIYLVTNDSTVLISSYNQVYQSLANLIRWADQVMLRADGEPINKDSANEIIKSVQDGIKELMQLSIDKLHRQKLARNNSSSSRQSSTSSDTERKSLPDIPLTPREMEIIQQTSKLEQSLRSSESPEPRNNNHRQRDDDDAPPPKPPLPKLMLGHGQPPPKPPLINYQQTSQESVEIPFPYPQIFQNFHETPPPLPTKTRSVSSPVEPVASLILSHSPRSRRAMNFAEGNITPASLSPVDLSPASSVSSGLNKSREDLLTSSPGGGGGSSRTSPSRRLIERCVSQYDNEPTNGFQSTATDVAGLSDQLQELMSSSNRSGSGTPPLPDKKRSLIERSSFDAAMNTESLIADVRSKLGMADFGSTGFGGSAEVSRISPSSTMRSLSASSSSHSFQQMKVVSRKSVVHQQQFIASGTSTSTSSSSASSMSKISTTSQQYAASSQRVSRSDANGGVTESFASEEKSTMKQFHGRIDEIDGNKTAKFESAEGVRMRKLAAEKESNDDGSVNMRFAGGDKCVTRFADGVVSESADGERIACVNAEQNRAVKKLAGEQRVSSDGEAHGVVAMTQAYSKLVMSNNSPQSMRAAGDEVVAVNPPPLPPKKRHVEEYMQMFGGYANAKDYFKDIVKQTFAQHSTSFYQTQWQQHQLEIFQPYHPRSKTLSVMSQLSSSSRKSDDVFLETPPPRSPVIPVLPPKRIKSPHGQTSVAKPVAGSLKTPKEKSNSASLAEGSNDRFTFDSELKRSSAPVGDDTRMLPSPREAMPDGNASSTSSAEDNPLDLVDVSNMLLKKTEEDDDSCEIRGGARDTLIVHAAVAGRNNFMYQEAFLTTYRTFIQSDELLKKLLYRYNRFCHSTDDKKKRLSRNTFSLIIRVVDELCTDINDDIVNMLSNLVFQLLCDGELMLAKVLRKKLLEKCELRRQLQDAPLLTSIPITNKVLSMLDFKSHDIAEQMTLLDADLFLKIEIPETLSWAKEQSEELSPNLTRFTEHFNKMSYWVRTRILEKDDSKDREKIMLKFIKIMKYLRKMHNFNSYLAILSALNSAPVGRLEWPKTITDTLKDMCDLIDSSQSFRAYRHALAETEPPCIPYIGMILQDLTFVHIGNPDLLPDGNVNFSKRWQFFNLLDALRRFRKCDYPFKRHSKIILMFNNFDDVLCEESLWQISETIKPRGGASKS
ncbi:uncharacterized protein LOC141908130 [Tubulanus polymorphus]|uniref:uncharacterized protein LOC141908130 n=1 Tax=Tubulanus polymorphus TaxID=672921 RepID=UPI003DA482BE